MANITSPAILTCDTNSDKPTARELCPFQHQLLWEPTLNAEEVLLWAVFGGGGGYEDEDKGIDLSWGTLPNGISLGATSGLISGTLEQLNLYHEVALYKSSKYEAKEEAGKPGKYTGWDITGNKYVSEGMIAYHTDNPGGSMTEFPFTVGLLTMWITPVGVPALSYTTSDHKIVTVPNNDPAAIALMYGADHDNLADDDGNKLTPQEYIDWRVSQGHDLSIKCK